MSVPKHLNISQPPSFPLPPTPPHTSLVPPQVLPFFVYHRQQEQQHKKRQSLLKLKMVETVNAEPIKFNFSNELSTTQPSADTTSLYSNDLHQISRDELLKYFSHLENRKYAVIPTVGNSGLPALEAMHIDHFDPAMVEKMAKEYSRRGTFYLLMFIKRQLGFKPARSSFLNLDLHINESLTSIRSHITSQSSGSASSRGLSKFLNKTSSGKYLVNMGTIRVRGYKKQTGFKVVVDPNFPYSYIDIDTIIMQTSAAKAMDGAFFSSSFKVVATPEYDPESVHNRVTIDIEIIPWGEEFDEMQSLKSLPNTLVPVVIGVQNGTTGPSNDNTSHASTLNSPLPSPTAEPQPSPKQKKRSFLNFKRPPSYYQPPADFSLFSPIPQNIQVDNKPSKNQKGESPNQLLTERNGDSSGDAAAEAKVPDLFKKKWTESSDEVITLMELSPDYPCILGKDWLNRLNEVVQSALTKQ